MSNPKKGRPDLLDALMDFAQEELTAEEADQALRKDGVDVDAFLARMRAYVAKREKEDRLSWKTAADASIAAQRARALPLRYAHLDRAGLVAALEARGGQAGAAAHHHKLQSLPDDDLRSLLSDLDELEGVPMAATAQPPFPTELEHLLPDFDAWVRGGRTPEDAALAAKKFRLTDAECQALKAEYLRRNRQFIDYTDPRVLRDNPRLESWYSGPDQPGAWCWPAYKKMLLDPARGWDPDDFTALDKASTKILASLPHPATPTFNSRGLVVGYVQSGKTANYSALISKAADVGYRLFIVLSGITSSLRRQTQSRLESDIVNHSPANWTLLTYPTSDFGRLPSSADALLDVQSHRKRVLAVVKKNVKILDRLISWLSTASPDTLQACPVILIDDEADNASINTRDPDEDPTAINDRIRKLLASLRKVAYVGYTATPFANIFIDPSVPTDLFPRNFIFDLDRPKAYFGAERIFGRDLLWFDPSEKTLDGLDVVRDISEADPDEPGMLLPERAKDRHDFEPVVPDSLRTATSYFLLATAARYARGQASQHSSMLVHTTMYVDLHDKMQELLDAHLEEFRKSWRGEKESLANLWEEESSKEPPPEDGRTSFDELVKHLPAVIARAEVVVDNGRTESGLVYSPDNPRVVIAVGGNTFSRGLTLEGLIVSYFIRRAGAYDTLLQMGRWFGYRRGYEDLPRIWMTNELQEHFFFLAGIEEEIRQDIRRLEKEGKTPEELAIRVRTHPKLMITAKNKMGGSRIASASYSNRRLQSFLFHHRNNDWLSANLAAARVLGRDLRDRCRPAGTGRQVAGGVPVSRVLEFLRSYRFHKDHDDLRTDLLEKYIAAENEKGSLLHWNVAFFGQAKEIGGLGTMNLGLNVDLNCISRTRFKMTEPCNIKALMSKSDRVIDLPDAPNDASDPDLAIFRNREAPGIGLLVVYPISRNSAPEGGEDSRWAHCPSCNQEHFVPAEGAAVRHPLNAAQDIVGVGLVFPGSRQEEATYMSVDLEKMFRPREAEEGEIVAGGEAELEQ